MKIAVVVERENEVWKLLEDGFSVFREEAEKLGHKMDYWHLLEDSDAPNYSVLDVITDYDFIMHSLHTNPITSKFMDNIPKRIKSAHFPHDSFGVQDDIGITPNHAPDIIFTCFKPHMRPVVEFQELAYSKLVPCRWWKADLLKRYPRTRNENLIAVVDGWDLPTDAEDQPSWEQHQQHPIPLSEICDYLASHDFEVVIKGVVKPKKYGDYTTGYLRTKGTIEIMNEAAFTIDPGSGMAHEVILSGCIPLLVTHKNDDVMKLIPTRQNMIVNYYKRYINAASPLLEHYPMKGVVSYIPGITKQYDTLTVLEKIRNMDRESVVKELNDFWTIDPGEPFYVTALREIENAA